MFLHDFFLVFISQTNLPSEHTSGSSPRLRRYSIAGTNTSYSLHPGTFLILQNEFSFHWNVSTVSDSVQCVLFTNSFSIVSLVLRRSLHMAQILLATIFIFIFGLSGVKSMIPKSLTFSICWVGISFFFFFFSVCLQNSDFFCALTYLFLHVTKLQFGQVES